jgi:predicted DsbA family dithiol-disulfide isomerase
MTKTHGHDEAVIEVFADILCPFTHVGLRRLVAWRDAGAGVARRLRVRAWPLEWVNGAPLDAALVAREIEALRAEVAPDEFAGFDAATFPRTSVPALALVSAAYATGDDAMGEQVSLELRDALFEGGVDVSDPGVLAAIAQAHDLTVDVTDSSRVRAEYEDGKRRGVIGSPYFIVDGTGWFCPTLEIAHDADGFDVRFDAQGFAAFAADVLAA